MKIEIQGFHGTSYQKAKEIITTDYKLSYGDDEWLGDGVYFFIEGLSKKPIEQAQKWAIAQSWDNLNKKLTYSSLSIIKSEIEVEEENFLDLTIDEGLEILDYIIEKHSDKISKLKKRFNHIDGLVINFARNENILPIEVSKGNFYIKFTKERMSNFDRRTSNCTICSVYLPAKNIKSKELVLTNEIE
ncbi:hypothetical protein [Lutibacter sp. B1]|uniref:hypothetical protein n=1 Tax=Lutibacter sp. B1 TaxID=2725996 RepID=UPI0014574015|nr:hypothetical protein [Lutibacter sp. B1]NLP59471.1 hypothetical protein [Lutibacter sp. B1]